MRHVIWIGIAFVLAACNTSTGTSSNGGLVTNTKTGTTGLAVQVLLAPQEHSIQAYFSDCNGDDVPDVLPSTSFASLTITLRDAFNRYFLGNQGVTFNSYRVSFQPLDGGAPALASRLHGQTIQIPIVGGGGAASSTIVLVEVNPTLNQYARRNRARSSVHTYNVTVTVNGRDWLNNQAIVAAAKAQIEIGAFCESIGGIGDEDGEEGGEET